jgi:hypothetical protein
VKDRNLRKRMEAYQESAQGTHARRGMGNWPVYAAVGGSALAMASNASANSIVYSGVIHVSAVGQANRNVTAPLQLAGNGYAHAIRIDVDRATHTSFSAGPPQPGFTSQSMSRSIVKHRYSGVAGLLPAAGDHLAINPNNLLVQVLGEGQDVSSAMFRFVNGGNFSEVAVKAPPNSNLYAGFAGNGAAAFAGLELDVNGQTHYGWIELSFTDAPSRGDQPQSLTVLAYALNDIAGQSILTGETSNSSSPTPNTPEPSTMAMAVLAAGSAGVLAWRRRSRTQN